MPLRGSTHSDNVRDEAPYFRNLSELDEWMRRPSAKLNGVIDYFPRSQVEGVPADNRGKLLLCHDYKGGYTETPSGLAYTFNFWPYCDTFVYFSHHRVTIPPSGWISAAHRHGVKMLGTLIFEDSGQDDCLRLLVGSLPKSKTGPAAPSSNSSLPISPHYARLLADLAYQRGFDGYLLNIECPLLGQLEQTRALTAWISILENELRRRIGSHSQVIWYDSVLVTGELRWQDRLNAHNLPFFIPSSGFFTNYTWPATYPSLTAQYFLNLDPLLMPHQKLLRDIFVGVDVWGRGQHGGGGFGSYRAILHIDPEFLGLSVALFGQAWTWETEQDKPDFTWESWWGYERKFWLGPSKEGELIELPPDRRRTGEPKCSHGPFVPITSFFPRAPPPNPAYLPFFTAFSPGVGRAWYVGGTEVLRVDQGWTDVHKNTSLGDLVWPRPEIQWQDGRQGVLPAVLPSLDMNDAWLGGSSLRLSLDVPGSDAEDAFFRSLWLPIQSLSITPQKTYAMTLVYKAESDKPVDFEVALSIQVLADGVAEEFEVIAIAQPEPDVPLHEWSKLSIQFSLPSAHSTDMLSAAGLVVGLAMEDPTQLLEISVCLGLLSVYAVPASPEIAIHKAKILWADHQSAEGDLTRGSDRFVGSLTWDVAAFFPGQYNVVIPTDSEDTRPLWRLDSSISSFAYFNIYVQPHSSSGIVLSPDGAIFIGTSGLNGEEREFNIDRGCLPSTLEGANIARFYVQGVTDRGDILEWDRCAYVDVAANP